MLPWHACNFDRRVLLLLLRLDVDVDVLEEIEVVDGREGLIGRFRLGEVLLGMGGGNDGKVTAERGFDFLVEVIAGWRISGWRGEEAVSWKG